ncbi:PiggyBac transposable element-derived protein 4 [Anthophora retusa]
MGKISRRSKLLKEINNLEQNCSDTEYDESDLVESTSEYLPSNNESPSESSNTDSEDEVLRRLRRKSKNAQAFSNSESESDQDVEMSVIDQDSEISVDGTMWKKLQEGSTPGRLPVHNIFKEMSGPTAYAKRHIMKGSVRTAFSLILCNSVMRHIKTCTEAEARRILNNHDWTVSLAELNAFIAILYACGAYEAKNLKLPYLWSEKWGPKFFSETMSRNKFAEILRLIRFDKKNERSQRLQTDKFALVSEVWKKFIENSQMCYKPGATITVDEQLFPTKTRCRFTQYMPNKPNKFGIKFWLASDVKSKYVVNAFPYLGKDEMRLSVPLGEFVVLKLIDPYIGCGRTVTTDNFFTSLPLATKLITKRTSLVGTIRQNKRELPKLAKSKKDNMSRFSTVLYKTEKCTLTIYKNVTDQMARKYTVKAGSRRWPLQVFYNILDLAGINAWILYKETTGENISRKDFLFQLSEELAIDYKELTGRSTVQTEGISSSISSQNQTHISMKRKRCQIAQCANNKTNNICGTCHKRVCGKCSAKITVTCKKCL